MGFREKPPVEIHFTRCCDILLLTHTHTGCRLHRSKFESRNFPNTSSAENKHRSHKRSPAKCGDKTWMEIPKPLERSHIDAHRIQKSLCWDFPARTRRTLDRTSQWTLRRLAEESALRFGTFTLLATWEDGVNRCVCHTRTHLWTTHHWNSRNTDTFSAIECHAHLVPGFVCWRAGVRHVRFVRVYVYVCLLSFIRKRQEYGKAFVCFDTCGGDTKQHHKITVSRG